MYWEVAYCFGMELRLHRNEQSVYELKYNDIVLAQSIELAEVMAKAEKYAKKFCKKLFISQAAVSDWYVGFPKDREQSPVVFFDPYLTVKAQLETETPYRFLEGPFLSSETAIEAAFKISGKQAVLLTEEKV